MATGKEVQTIGARDVGSVESALQTPEMRVGGSASLSRLLEAEKLDPIHSDLQDVINALSERHKGTFSRSVRKGQVVAALELEDGDRRAGIGADTAEAVEKLRAKLEGTTDAGSK